MTLRTQGQRVIFDSDSHIDDALTAEEQTFSVAEAARLLGRDRTRVYALLRSGDLVAAPDDEEGAGPARGWSLVRHGACVSEPFEGGVPERLIVHTRSGRTQPPF